MNILKILLVCVCIVIGSPFSSRGAGQEQREAKGARKLDEFGYGSGVGQALSECDVTAHLDNFAYFLEKEPASRGYIISYKGRGKIPKIYPHQLEWQYDWLTLARGIEGKRVVAVSGGYRDEPSVELWIVPEGAEAPRLTPTLVPRKRRK